MKLRIKAWVRRWTGTDWEHFVEGDIVEDDTEWGRRLLRLGAATIAPGSDPTSQGISESVPEHTEVVTSSETAVVTEEDSPAVEIPEAETPASDRPLMTASIAVWREYAAKLGIKTTGMKKDEIIGAVNTYESQ